MMTRIFVAKLAGCCNATVAEAIGSCWWWRHGPNGLFDLSFSQSYSREKRDFKLFRFIGSKLSSVICHLQQYYENRLKILTSLKAAGGNPYPYKFQVSMTITEYIEQYRVLSDGNHLKDVEVSLAGTFTLSYDWCMSIKLMWFCYLLMLYWVVLCFKGESWTSELLHRSFTSMTCMEVVLKFKLWLMLGTTY